jgi:RHS repeat-associated protein
MVMPGRKYSAGTQYRYGFNGKENDNEVKGEGNQQDYGMRIYDPRLGRFLSNDPLSKNFPYYSPYQFAGCNPIRNIDLDGGEPLDYKENWLNMTLVIDGVEGRSATNMQGKDYRVVYDKITKQSWFIHEGNNGEYEYWQHNPGANQSQYITSNTGKKDNGQWKPFKTQNQIDDIMRVKLTNSLVDGFSTAIFLGGLGGAAAPVASLTVTALSSSYAGRGAINATIDASAQLIANGGDVNDLNLTSIAMSFALPDVKSFGGLLLKNSVSNGLQLNSGKGYQGFFGEGVNNKNVLTNIAIGTVLDKTSSTLQNLNNGVTNAAVTRWSNLSYKPKFADKLLQFQRNSKIENVFKSPVTQTTLGSLNNLASQKPTP